MNYFIQKNDKYLEIIEKMKEHNLNSSLYVIFNNIIFLLDKYCIFEKIIFEDKKNLDFYNFLINEKCYELLINLYCCAISKRLQTIIHVDKNVLENDIFDYKLHYISPYCYLEYYNPQKDRKYLYQCIDSHSIISNMLLTKIKESELTHDIEKITVEKNFNNIYFVKYLNDDEIIEVIRNNKQAIFLVKKLSYKIILETIKMYGNFIFMEKSHFVKLFNNVNETWIRKEDLVREKISLDFLSQIEIKNLMNELKNHNKNFAKREYHKLTKKINIFYH